MMGGGMGGGMMGGGMMGGGMMGGGMMGAMGGGVMTGAWLVRLPCPKAQLFPSSKSASRALKNHL